MPYDLRKPAKNDHGFSDFLRIIAVYLNYLKYTFQLVETCFLK